MALIHVSEISCKEATLIFKASIHADFSIVTLEVKVMFESFIPGIIAKRILVFCGHYDALWSILCFTFTIRTQTCVNLSAIWRHLNQFNQIFLVAL